MKSSALVKFATFMVAWILALPLCSALAGGSEWIYSVRPGDTLITVANTYLSHPDKWDVLRQLNNVADPKHLLPGTRLRIPVALLKREATMAEVVRMQGEVHKVGQQENTDTKLAVGAQLAVGDIVKTGPESNVTLRFSDGSRLLLLEKSSLILKQLLSFGKTGMAQTVLELRDGGVETQAAPQRGPAARYEIKSPVLNLGVRGTDFRVRVENTGQSARSEVLSGRVSAQGNTATVQLNAGFGTSAVLGAAPSLPKKLPNGPDLHQLPALLEQVPVRFDWPEMAGINKYHAQIFVDRSFEQLLRDGLFTGHTAKWADLPDGKYVLRVRAIDAEGMEGLNSDHDFILKARPEPPFTVEPQDGKNAYGAQARLRWSKSTTAFDYHLQVSALRDFSSLLSDEPHYQGTEYTMPLSPGHYFWRVASRTADADQGPYSDIQSFNQRKIPESPAIAPPTMDDTHLSVSWKAGEPGSKYQLQLARDSGFEQLELDKVVTENNLSMARPESGTHFLRIKAIEADGFAGPYGPAQQIDVPGFSWWWLLPVLLLAV